MSKNIYDLIIIGAGPAGLTAAIYAGRRNLNTLVISLDAGGQVALTGEVENYPGFEMITGFELAQKFKQQAEKWGVQFIFNEAGAVKKVPGGFKVQADKKEYWAKALILAFGLTPKKLKVPGEAELRGKGVTYCATCDGPLFKNKIVGVVGGGNSALEAAEYLAHLAKKVYLIHRSDEFRAESYLITQAKKLKNLEFYCYSEVKEIKGKNKLAAVVLASNQDKNKTEELALDGLFIEIGYEAKTDWLKGFIKLNQKGEIMVNRDSETSQPGVFAAGDCTDARYKQIIISGGEGAKAALMAYQYIVAKGGINLTPDWGRCELVGSEKAVKIKLEK